MVGFTSRHRLSAVVQTTWIFNHNQGKRFYGCKISTIRLIADDKCGH